MNTMLNNSSSLKNSFLKFAENIKKSGKDPKDLLDEVLASGKYSKADIERAKQMATRFLPLVNGL